MTESAGESLRCWITKEGGDLNRVKIVADSLMGGYSLYYHCEDASCSKGKGDPVLVIPKQCLIYDQVAYDRLSSLRFFQQRFQSLSPSSPVPSILMPFFNGKSMLTLFICCELGEGEESYSLYQLLNAHEPLPFDSSYFGPYWKCLPQKFQDPYHWTVKNSESYDDASNEEALGKFLYPTNLYFAVKERKSALIEEWKQVKEMLVDLVKGSDSEATQGQIDRLLTLDLWFRAKSIIYSRAFSSESVLINDGNRACSDALLVPKIFLEERQEWRQYYSSSGFLLIPGGDLGNHDPRVTVQWQQHHPQANSNSHSNDEIANSAMMIGFWTSSVQGADGNSLIPILNNYGLKSNEELLHGYGFTICNNGSSEINPIISLDYYAKKVNFGRDPKAVEKKQLLSALLKELVKQGEKSKPDPTVMPIDGKIRFAKEEDAVVLLFNAKDFELEGKSSSLNSNMRKKRRISDTFTWWYSVFAILVANEAQVSALEHIFLNDDEGEIEASSWDAVNSFLAANFNIRNRVLGDTLLAQFQDSLGKLKAHYPNFSDSIEFAFVKTYWDGLLSVCESAISHLQGLTSEDNEDDSALSESLEVILRSLVDCNGVDGNALKSNLLDQIISFSRLESQEELEVEEGEDEMEIFFNRRFSFALSLLNAASEDSNSCTASSSSLSSILNYLGSCFGNDDDYEDIMDMLRPEEDAENAGETFDQVDELMNEDEMDDVVRSVQGVFYLLDLLT